MNQSCLVASRMKELKGHHHRQHGRIDSGLASPVSTQRPNFKKILVFQMLTSELMPYGVYGMTAFSRIPQSVQGFFDQADRQMGPTSNRSTALLSQMQ